MSDFEYAKAIGEHPAFIVCAYLMALVPWAVLNSYDFLDSNFRPLISIRRTARLHAIITSIPSIYILTYTISQIYAEDYKEMCTGFAALFLAGIHFTRCMVTLVHVRCFKQWMEDADVCIDALGGYRRTLTCVNRSGTIDDVLVNNLVFDNAITGGDLGSRLRKLKSRWMPRYNYRHQVRILPFLDLPVERFGLAPQDPVAAFVRWSVITLFQCQTRWLHHWQLNRDVLLAANDLRSRETIAPNTDPESIPWSRYRACFARDMWLTALFSVTCHVYGRPDMVSKLSPWILANHTKHGVFAFRECVRCALFSGLGLPYNAPSDHYRMERTIANYTAQLEHAIVVMPPPNVEAMVSKDLNMVMLEWFLVLLYLYRLSVSNTPIKESNDTHFFRKSGLEMRSLEENRYPGIHVRVLNQQLGFDPNSDAAIKSPLDSGLPIMNPGYGPFLWHSLTVCQTCAHIDNYLALWRGETLAWYTRNQAAHSATCDMNTESREGQAELAEKGCRGKLLRDIAFNTDRQWAYNRFTNSLRYLGAVMEGLRSLLAVWQYALEKDPPRDQESPEVLSTWICEIPASQKVRFTASTQLQGILKHTLDLDPTDRIFLDRTLKMRILWECQAALYRECHKRVSEHSRKPLPTCLEAMALCILAFPSLTISYVQPSKAHRTEPINYLITPESSPQPVSLFLSFTKEAGGALKGEISVYPNMTVTHFKWESWRDAFEGRMQGMYEWARSRGPRTNPPLVTNGPISAGIKVKEFNHGQYPYWAGWLPSNR